MRPPAPKLSSKNRYPNLIVIIGLLSGILITTLIWLKLPNQFITPLFWLSPGLIGLGSFLYLRRLVEPRPRWVSILAVVAAVSLVYLFPEMFGPACGGMPRAFALNCPRECEVQECTRWIAGPSAECPKPGSGGGCCLSYETTCDPNCEPPPPPPTPLPTATPPPPDLPPTISSTLSCTTWGLNGWCTGSLTLQLTASQPQGKQLQISGDVAGTPFACPPRMGSVNCSVPLPQGTGTANYLATSITGLTASGSATYKHDSTLPQINGWLNGTNGDNGWFISQVNVNASASDTLPGSGLSAWVYNLNAGGWKSYTGPLSLSDGVHSLSLRASDAAGNMVNTSQTIKVDTVTPALNLSVTGTTGTNGWYRSNVQVGADVSDSGSGLNTIEYDLDGAGWTAYTVPLELSDGIHSLSLRASDAAGNVVGTNQTVKVDTVTPALDLSVAGTAGTSGWYRSNVQVSADVSDSGSGLNTIEYDLDGAGWTAYSVPLELSDGIHSLSVRSLDTAGNSTTWTQTFQVDTITPLLDLTIGGTLGTGGWYTSLLQISMTASDPGSSPSEVSGLSALEYNLDGTGWAAYSDPLELSDGLYNLDVRAIDAAGNLTSGTKSFRVDAVAPTLEVNVSGTQGASPWYVSIVQVEAVADDVTSDLSTLEVKVDGGDWSVYNAPLAIGDGPHSYRFRATDNAGNQSLTPVQSLQVDTIPPAISLPKSWDLGKTADFELRDNGSGLASVRIVIEDEDERYPKVTWEDALSSYEFDGEINWNGRFQDKSRAVPGGEYYATLKVVDNAGNENRMAGQIKVPLISYLETLIDSSGGLVSGTEGSDPIVTLIPGSDSDEAPVSQTPDESAPSTFSFGGDSNNADASGEQSILGFGGGNNEAGATGEQSTLNLGGGNNGAEQPSDAQTGKTSFSAGNPSTLPVDNIPSNILWGATATAAIGAFAAEILRKKQEEEAKAAAAAAEKATKKESRGESNYRQKIKANKLAKLKTKWAVERALAEQQRKEAAIIARYTAKEEAIKAELLTYGNKPQVLGQSNDQYLAQKAYEMYRAGEVAAHTKIAPPPEKEKSGWEKSLDWVDAHQTEIALGVGVAVGIAAIVMSAGTATPLVAAGLAALAAGTTVAGGTALLNAHYGRALSTNVLRNVGTAAIPAAIIAGVGVFLVGAGPQILSGGIQTVNRAYQVLRSGIQVVQKGYQAVNTGLQLWSQRIAVGVTTVCTARPWVCGKVEQTYQLLDIGESLQLQIKLIWQTIKRDEVGATETAVDIQMEQMDMGTPGNTVAKEVREMGIEFAELAQRYGDELRDLVKIYGDDAIHLIKVYGPEGIEWLYKYGKNARLKPLLDEDLFQDALEQGSEALEALAHWTDDDLLKYGEELVSRAPRDAKAIKAASELAKLDNIDSPEARKLIETIAENSIMGNGDRLVLGKWVPEKGLDGGFTGAARTKNDLYYGTNPGMQKALEDLPIPDQEKIFWAVNEQVLQKAVDSKWKIDYSFNGFDEEELGKEIRAIKAIASGQSREEVARILGKFPFRMREVEFLIKQGYKYEVDLLTQAVHFTKP